MSWFKSTLIRSSIHALFSTGAGSAGGRPADDGANMEDIRHRMLALTSQDDGERGALLARRIRYATELQALWFMRGELMALLAHTYGEAAARQMSVATFIQLDVDRDGTLTAAEISAGRDRPDASAAASVTRASSSARFRVGSLPPCCIRPPLRMFLTS